MDDRIPRGLSQTYWSSWTGPTSSRSGASAGSSANASAGSVAAWLDEGEAWVGGWDSVGLYEGNNKVEGYQVLQVHITTHRLLLLPDCSDFPPPSSTSSGTRSSRSALPPPALQLSLANVRQTEFYNGFMRSSAKITLHLGVPAPSTLPSTSSSTAPSTSAIPTSTSAASASTSTGVIGSSVPSHATSSSLGGSGDNSSGLTNWTCGVCGFVNASGTKCQLCGVGISSVPPSRSGTPISTLPRPHSSASMPLNGKGTVPGAVPGSVPPENPSTTSVAPAAPAAPAGPDPPADPEGRIPCPTCTFLNHPSLLACEICSTPLPSRRRPVSVSSAAELSMNGGGGGAGGVGKGWDVARLSFRKGGEKEAYRRLKNVLVQKAWEVKKVQRSDEQSGAGIDGILRTINLEAQAQDANMQDAFKDLEVLMVRAGEMVRMAQSLAGKLTYQSSEEDASLIRTSLVQLGLPAPALTHDMVKDDGAYHEGLAMELGALLTGAEGSVGPSGPGGAGAKREGLMRGSKSRGVIGLDEVWGLWMRARGVALLPPSTLLSVIPYVPTHTSPPIRLLTLPSGLKVFHVPHYAPSNLLSRLVALLEPIPSDSSTITDPANVSKAVDSVPTVETVGTVGTEKSLSLVEIAAHEGLAIGLAKDLIESIENNQLGQSTTRRLGDSSRLGTGIVSDEQAGYESGGVRWYRDLISSWPIEAMRSD